MATINGTDIKLFSTGTTDLVAFAQNCTLTLTHNVREITNKGSAGFKELADGMREFTIEVDGLYAYDNGGSALSNGADDLIQTNILASRTKVDFIFGGAVTGDFQYSGSGFITSVSLTAGTEDNATYSITIDGTDGLSQGQKA